MHIHAVVCGNRYVSVTEPNSTGGVKTKRVRWAECHTEETIKAYKILVCMWEGMISLSTPRCRWEDNVTIYLTEQGVEWVHLTPKWGRCLTLRLMTMNVKVLLKRGVSLLG
jgi:hypothetical protein